MSEGLAYHLSQGRNHLWFILTLICTIAFLGFLLGLMIFEYRNNHCVFSGPSACYTNLANTSQADELPQIELNQVTEKPSGLTLGEHELLTFQYIDNSSDGKSFFVDLHYKDFDAGHGITYPSNLALASGFCIKVSEGVSIYLKYYFDNTPEWENSHNVVEYGITQYINTITDGFAYVQPIETNGFVYITSGIGTHGTPSITSSREDSFYFQTFKENKGSKQVLKPSSSPISYNPMHDFFEAKEKTKQSRGCNNSEKPCVCIDPSSKNLPSCKQNYIAGQGYLIPNSSPLKYTTNCSHSYFPGETVPGGTDKQTNYVEQLVSAGSQLASSLQTKPSSTKSDGSDWPSSKGGGLPDPSQVPLKIGSKPFKSSDPDLSSWTNSYDATNIFCGKGAPSNPETMNYSIKVGDPTVFVQMSGSSVPNTTVPAGGGKVKLGFN